jgi:hypothetical protein
MNNENMIICPKTKGDACYVTEISENIKGYFSFSCGFWTNSLMTKESELYKEQIELLPELYKDLAWEDPETGLVWFPHTVNEEKKGMIFAYGTGVDNWGWAAVKAVEIPENERKEIMGKIQTHKMDMGNMKVFHERDYIEALSFINILPE